MAKTNLNRETTIIKCEDYMLRGYDRPSEISELLGIAYNTAREYIDLVKARWEIQGDPAKRESARAELIKKAEEVIKEGWLLKSNAKNTQEKVSAMRIILHAIERLTKLHGLDVNHQDSPIIMSMHFQRERQLINMASQIHEMPETEKTKAITMIQNKLKEKKAAKKD